MKYHFEKLPNPSQFGWQGPNESIHNDVKSLEWFDVGSGMTFKEMYEIVM